ncbi:hypothetical protein Trydic_g15608, partial [Trypoxylus dichotomus]
MREGHRPWIAQEDVHPDFKIS